MAKNKNKETRYFGQIFLLIAIFLVALIYFFNKNNNQDIRSRAEDADPNFCEHYCKSDGSRCDLNNPNLHYDDNYDDPCCQEIAKTGSPYVCNWVKRDYCTVDQCNAIPAGAPRERCGGARWGWCNKCKENNCPGYGKTPVAPTAMPTNPPVVIPSEIPTQVVVYPTEIVLPPTNPPIPTQVIRIPPQVTYIPVIFPTLPPPPTATPTSVPFQLTLPRILPPKEKIESFVSKVKFDLLDFLSKILP